MKFFDNEEMKRQEVQTSTNLHLHLAKSAILASLKNYVEEREGFFSFTWLFRNKALTQEKIALTRNTISLIETNECNPQELCAALRSLRIENAKLSAKFGKYHCNLMSKQGPGYMNRQVSPEELESQSGLANILHDAIEELDKFLPYVTTLKVVNK